VKISDTLKTAATLTTRVPSFQLSTRELVERIKTLAKNPSVGYGLFVKERLLKPEIGMKDFAQLWDQVGANPHMEKKTVTFKATHVNKQTPKMRVMVISTSPTVVQYVIEYGPNSYSTGSDPAALFAKNYQPV
jgi:hypothetical protein